MYKNAYSSTIYNITKLETTHSSIIYNIPKLETTQIPFERQIVAYS